MKSRRNIFIIGLDDFNLAKLKRLPEASECEFIPAIKYSEMRGVDNISIPELIKKCDERIKEKKRIDAIVTYFDFPGSVLVPIIAKKYNLPGPSLEGVLKCEHKYWSRLEQKKVIPDNIPEFEIFDPFDKNAFDKIDLAPPFWIKPVKSYHSFLAYRIKDHKQFKKHIKEILPQIGFMARPFKFILKEYFMPAEFAGMTEKMIAENEIRGHQCTAEGYVFDGEAEIYGIVDSVREEESSSFLRYEYPSSLPGEAQKAIVSLAKKAILQTGIMNSAFNIEFFYDKKNDQPMNYIAQHFPAGNQLRISISSSYWPLAWPSPEPSRLTIYPSESYLVMPKRTVGKRDVSKKALGKPGELEELETTLLVPHKREWIVERNLATNEVTLEIENDDPQYLLHHINTELRKDATEKYYYSNNKYDTVRGEVKSVREFRREDWKIKTITRTILTSTRTHFIIRATLDAYEGDVRVYNRAFDEKVPRDMV